MNWHKIYSKIWEKIRKETTLSLVGWKVNTTPQENVAINQVQIVVKLFWWIKQLYQWNNWVYQMRALSRYKKAMRQQKRWNMSCQGSSKSKKNEIITEVEKLEAV